MSLFVKKFVKFMRNNQSNFNSYHKKDIADDNQACFNWEKKVHFIILTNFLTELYSMVEEYQRLLQSFEEVKKA